jgi:hypothetical protein
MAVDRPGDDSGKDLVQPFRRWWSLPLTVLVILLILLLRRRPLQAP